MASGVNRCFDLDLRICEEPPWYTYIPFLCQGVRQYHIILIVKPVIPP